MVANLKMGAAPSCDFGQMPCGFDPVETVAAIEASDPYQILMKKNMELETRIEQLSDQAEAAKVVDVPDRPVPIREPDLPVVQETCKH